MAQATGRYIRGGPTKVRLVADSIRGRGVPEALGTLQLSKRRAARQLEKVVRSAIANAENLSPGVDVDRLYVAEVFVNQGPSLPMRIRPQPMGRAYPIIKRTSHITVRLSEREG
ncbi:MAG: 50S ribosomal protein L22 [Acidobacteriota bacterium]